MGLGDMGQGSSGSGSDTGSSGGDKGSSGSGGNLGKWYTKLLVGAGAPSTVGDVASKLPKVGGFVQKLPGMDKSVGDLLDKVPVKVPDPDKIFLLNLARYRMPT